MIPSLGEMLAGTANYKSEADGTAKVYSTNYGLINIMKLKINRSIDEMEIQQKQKAAFKNAIFATIDGFFVKEATIKMEKIK